MKYILKIFCSAALLFVFSNAFSQSNIPINTQSKQPILIDDVHSESLKMAKESFDNRLTSSNSVWKSLTEKQKTKILKVEADRLYALKKIDTQISAKNGYLKTLDLFSTKNAKVVEKTKSEIAGLALERQKVIVRYKKKIRAQLTADQRAVFDLK